MRASMASMAFFITAADQITSVSSSSSATYKRSTCRIPPDRALRTNMGSTFSTTARSAHSWAFQSCASTTASRSPSRMWKCSGVMTTQWRPCFQISPCFCSLLSSTVMVLRLAATSSPMSSWVSSVVISRPRSVAMPCRWARLDQAAHETLLHIEKAEVAGLVGRGLGALSQFPEQQGGKAGMLASRSSNSAGSSARTRASSSAWVIVSWSCPSR